MSATLQAFIAVLFVANTGLDEDLVTCIVALSICVGIARLPWLPPLIQVRG